jgi:hypothetical protein
MLFFISLLIKNCNKIQMIISEKALAKGIEVDMSNAEHKLPNRAIRFNNSVNSNKYELYNYTNNEVDYTFSILSDLLELTNLLFKRDDTCVSEISYHSDDFKQGGSVKTYRDKYNEKYGYKKNTSHSLKDISKKSGVSLKGLQQIYNKGIGAFKTNPESVRKNVSSKEQWAMGRVYSAVMGGKASRIDKKELEMEKGGLFVGKSHAEGGIPVKVKSTGQDIEVEGGEIIINKRNSASTKKNTFNGKEMTNCEVLSEINQQNGNGVKINCDSIEGKKYKHKDGGRLAKGGELEEIDKIFDDYYGTGGEIKYIYPENSLGMEKKDLPQIRSKDKPFFIEYLNNKYNRNMATMRDDVLASTLSPIQDRINPNQLKVIDDSGGLRKGSRITISNDGYVIDGHHRWYYAKEKGLEIPVLEIDLPVEKLIAESFASGFAEKEDIDSVRGIGVYGRGGISDYLERKFDPTNIKEEEVLKIIPTTTNLNSDELSKIDFDFLYANINQAPQSKDYSIYDEKQVTAYLRYYNDFGTNYFVTQYQPNSPISDNQGNFIVVGEFGGYYLEADNQDNAGNKYFKLPDLFLDYGDDMVNFKLDYDFTPQTINGALALIGLKQYQSMDVKPIGRSFTDFDIDTIINKTYKSRVERNSAIINMVSYLGIDQNAYDVDAKNFISTYSCYSFRSIRSPKLYRVMAGMIYQDIANRDIEINNCITFGDCCGSLCSYFDEKIEIIGIDSDKTSNDIASILNQEATREFITEKTLETNPIDSQKDSAIIFNDNILTINQEFSYVKPNGIIVALVFVNDFEDYFLIQSNRDDFLEKYKLLDKYRISTENLLLHIQKIKN